MSKLTKSPNTVDQGTHEEYVTFSGLNNIKNTSNSKYAVSSTYIKGKSETNGKRPSWVSASNFKFNIPSNSVVKKITVHYRHSRRARCGSNNNYTPCNSSNTDKRCNIPAPYIELMNTQPNVHKKGQAPYAKIRSDSSTSGPIVSEVVGEYGKLNNTATFKGLWPASIVNQRNFGAMIVYPENANNQTGYVLLFHIYITIEYFTPSFTVSGKSANGGKVYNKGEYHLRVNLSDSNTTRKSTNVNITAPLGFSYKGVKGSMNGKVTGSGRNLVWAPNMGASSASVELVFDVDVTFSQGTSSVVKTFSLGLPVYSSTVSFSDTIYKELPPEATIEGGDVEQIINEETIDTTEIKYVKVNECIQFNFDIPDDFPTGLCIFGFPTDGTDTPILNQEDTDVKLRDYRGDFTITQYSNNDYWGLLTSPESINSCGVLATEKGRYVLLLFDAYNMGGTAWSNYTSATPLGAFVLDVKPLESDLTSPNYTILPIDNTEETDRLGHTYNYTVQSNLKLDTSETYVRDWYRNFRVGVFNNPILSNITGYYDVKNTETEFDSYLPIPTLYELDGATLTVAVDHSIGIDGTTVSSSTTLSDLTEYNIPVTFTKVSDNTVILTLTLKDSSNNTLWTKDYHITFQADESTDLTEITTDTTDYSNLTDTEIYTNAEYWADETAGLNTNNSVECEFTYNKNYPLYIIITGDYPEGDQDNNDIEFTEPCIIETSTYETKLDNGTYPVPIDDIILTDGSTSDLTLTPYTVSDTLVLYDLPLDDHYGTDTEKAIRGIELTGDIEQSDRLVLHAKLKSPTGASRERSIVINDTDSADPETSFSIGGNGDLWGFNTLDIIELEDWEIEFTISNSLEETDSSINFGNLKLILYIEQVENQTIKCYIDGQDIAYYGAFITDINIPEGLQTSTAYLNVDGTDINDAYRQNIREKEITINFDIGDGCDLETSTLSLREFAKLLVNDRDEYNRPIPKKIMFSHYPDVYWEYIMEEAFDSELDINTYVVKAKLTVPAGTSYDRKTTTTSNTGYVNGLASINPSLIVKPTGEVITIRETITGQEFHIGYTGEWTDKILEIDCEDRICWLKTNEEDTDPVNMNKYIDYNSDWFVLKGEYAFEGINCVIRTVDYAERW